MMINMENTKKRLTNLDLLKVVSMVMIVCLHYLGHGGVLEKATLTDGNYYIAWLFEILSIVGVNCFILCTGYLMTENHFRFSKLVYLWLQIISINLVCVVIALITGDYKFTAGTILNVFCPISLVKYWYISAYFIFYMLSPFLIWAVNKLTIEQHKKLTIALVIIFTVNPLQWTEIKNGYHFVWFCVLFFAASYIRRAELFKKRVRTYFAYYLVLTLVLMVVNMMTTKLSNYFDIIKSIDVRNYNFLFTFLLSLMLFAAFKNIRIKQEKLAGMVTFLSSLTLGVYLIHENGFIRDFYWKKVFAPLEIFDKPYFVLHMIACVLGVFFICAFLEYARQLLFKLFNIPSLCEKLGEKVQGIVDKVFNSNIIEKM